jgi:hypothetical protein
MNGNHSIFKTRTTGEDAELSVFLVLLKARQGPYPFVRFETLRDNVSLPNGDLEEALTMLEERGKIEHAEPSRGEVYYYAVW